MCTVFVHEVCKMHVCFNRYFQSMRVNFLQSVTSYWGIILELERCFGYRSFPMLWLQAAERAVGWMVVWHQGQHAVCSADAALCSREIPRWCRLSGVSQEAITFQSENKLTGLWQPESLIAKSLFCKGLCSWRLVLFLWNLLRSQRTPNYILKKSFGKRNSCFFLLVLWEKRGIKAHNVLAC